MARHSFLSLCSALLLLNNVTLSIAAPAPLVYSPTDSDTSLLNDDASDTNMTTRLDAASVTLDPLDLLKLLNEPREPSISVDEEHLSGSLANQTGGITVVNTTQHSSLDYPDDGRTLNGPGSSSEDQASVFSKRNIDQWLKINSVQHPFRSSRGVDIVPVNNVDPRSVRVLAAKAQRYALKQAGRTDGPRYEPSAFYNFTYGALTLSARAYGRAAEGNDPFNWHDFYNVAMTVWNNTRSRTESKLGWVGNVCSADNSTQFADWAVIWTEEIIEIDEPRGTCINVTVEDGNGGSGNKMRKRGLVGDEEVRGSELSKRRSEGAPNPIHIPIGNSGYKIVMYQGTKTALAFLYHAVVDAAATGLNFLEARGDNEGSCWKEMHYLPNWMNKYNAYLTEGFNFVVREGASVSESTIVNTMKVLRRWSEQDVPETWSTLTSIVNSRYGEVIDPEGNVFAHWAWGDVVSEGARATVRAVVDAGQAAAGTYARSHDEL